MRWRRRQRTEQRCVLADLVESLIQLHVLVWAVPDFRILCRRQMDSDVHIPYSCKHKWLALR